MNRRLNQHSRIGRRRGGAYVLVLIAVAIATGAALTAIALARAEHALAGAEADGAGAAAAAASGLELALGRIGARADWRTLYGDGGVVGIKDLDGATVDVVASDPKDGDLGNGSGDAFELLAIAECGEAVRSVRASVEPYHEDLDCLRCAVHAAGAITLLSTSTLNADAVVSTNADVTATLATVNAAVEASGSITGVTYFGSKTAGADARTLPVWEDVQAAYTAVGTAVSTSGINNGIIEQVAIGPGANPYGSADSDGVYIINCKGGNLTIRNCRIVGTVVLVNAGTVTVDQSVSIQPMTTGEASLVVSGSLVLNLSKNALSEKSLGQNLNPTGVPDRGRTDSERLDSYASEIRGVVYATGGITFKGTGTVVKGVVICGGTVKVDTGATATILFSTAHCYAPPAAFQGPLTYRVLAGTLKRVLEK